MFVRGTAQVGTPDHHGTRHSQFRDEGVLPTAVGVLKRMDGGEIGRRRIARDIDLALPVQSNPVSLVVAGAAEISTEDQGCAVPVQFQDESVLRPGKMRLNRFDNREIGGRRGSR